MQPDPAPTTDATFDERRRLVGQTARVKEATLQYVGVLTVLLILIAIFSFLQPQFHTWTNLLNILQTNAVLMIVSVGLTFVLLVGGFDLSIGGVLALSGVFIAELLRHGVGTIAAMLVVLVGGVLLGIACNGYPISRLGANFFMVTLGVSFATRGVALVITNGESKGLYNHHLLRSIGNGGYCREAEDAFDVALNSDSHSLGEFAAGRRVMLDVRYSSCGRSRSMHTASAR